MRPYRPGLSLGLPEGSEKRWEDVEGEAANLHRCRLHVDYEGTRDPGKPLWTTRNFEAPVIPEMSLRLTRLDEPRPVRPRAPTHPPASRTGSEALLFGDPLHSRPSLRESWRRNS